LDERKWDLCKYRMQQARESLNASKIMLQNEMIKDAINRSYYAVFYALKAVLAIEEKDFRRHKDVVAHFNKMYVATGKFPREFGRLIAKLQQLREKSDYDDFFIVSIEKAHQQTKSAENTITEVEKYLRNLKQKKDLDEHPFL
jgi:Uncharacterized conserved protein related to C-terminal domain of eukaryotic chaperone, SACSIN